MLTPGPHTNNCVGHGLVFKVGTAKHWHTLPRDNGRGHYEFQEIRRPVCCSNAFVRKGIRDAPPDQLVPMTEGVTLRWQHRVSVLWTNRSSIP